MYIGHVQLLGGKNLNLLIVSTKPGLQRSVDPAGVEDLTDCFSTRDEGLLPRTIVSDDGEVVMAAKESFSSTYICAAPNRFETIAVESVMDCLMISAVIGENKLRASSPRLLLVAKHDL